MELKTFIPECYRTEYWRKQFREDLSFQSTNEKKDKLGQGNDNSWLPVICQQKCERLSTKRILSVTKTSEWKNIYV